MRSKVLPIFFRVAVDPVVRIMFEVAFGGQTPQGCGATRTLERVAAAVGVLRGGAPIKFERAIDVPGGGVLLALPALLQHGLLAHRRQFFSMPESFYRLESIFLLLAFMALARIRSIEALRYQPPGEWGKFMGLDRIPEVRTLREKIGDLCSENGQAAAWSGTLAKEWMEDQSAESAGVFYADGHVRVYHGKLTKLPRRDIAREKLCQRGTTDYWINAMDGQPFSATTSSPAIRGRKLSFARTRSRSSRARKWRWNSPSAAPASPTVCGCARSDGVRRAANKARLSAPIIRVISCEWPPACSPDGVRRTSSVTRDNTLD